jgi:hypothetical protein
MACYGSEAREPELVWLTRVSNDEQLTIELNAFSASRELFPFDHVAVNLRTSADLPNGGIRFTNRRSVVVVHDDGTAELVGPVPTGGFDPCPGRDGRILAIRSESDSSTVPSHERLRILSAEGFRTRTNAVSYTLSEAGERSAPALPLPRDASPLADEEFGTFVANADHTLGFLWTKRSIYVLDPAAQAVLAAYNTFSDDVRFSLRPGIVSSDRVILALARLTGVGLPREDTSVIVFRRKGESAAEECVLNLPMMGVSFLAASDSGGAMVVGRSDGTCSVHETTTGRQLDEVAGHGKKFAGYLLLGDTLYGADGSHWVRNPSFFWLASGRKATLIRIGEHGLSATLKEVDYSSPSVDLSLPSSRISSSGEYAIVPRKDGVLDLHHVDGNVIVQDVEHFGSEAYGYLTRLITGRDGTVYLVRGGGFSRPDNYAVGVYRLSS